MPEGKVNLFPHKVTSGTGKTVMEIVVVEREESQRRLGRVKERRAIMTGGHRQTVVGKAHMRCPQTPPPAPWPEELMLSAHSLNPWLGLCLLWMQGNEEAIPSMADPSVFGDVQRLVTKRRELQRTKKLGWSLGWPQAGEHRVVLLCGGRESIAMKGFLFQTTGFSPSNNSVTEELVVLYLTYSYPLILWVDTSLFMGLPKAQVAMPVTCPWWEEVYL